MKAFLAFWKKDIINKLIVVTIVAIILGVISIARLIGSMPQGKSLPQAFADFLPGTATPTFDINAYLIVNTNMPPVMATAPLTLPSLTPPAPTVTMVVSTSTLTISASETPGAVDHPVVELSACIPDNPPETGRVLEIIDGNTIKVLIDGKVYVVRYIGIKVPRDGEIKEPFGPAATFVNGKLVYGKDIVLFSDVTDKDSNGRLLRYVKIGEIFVNLEMIQQGFGLVEDISPNSACAEAFATAEQEARRFSVGQWVNTPTP